MRRKKILFVIKASNSWGYGHLYRTIRLCNKLKDRYDIKIISNYDVVTKQLIFENGLEYVVGDDESALEIVKDEKVETIVVDKLNNSESFIQTLKQYVDNVILFDDQGEGAHVADVLINALVDLPSKAPKRVYSGADYVVYSEEMDVFSKLEPIHRDQIKNILLTFGGSDPQNIAELMMPIVKENALYEFVLVLGPGYKNAKKFVEQYGAIENLTIYCNLSSLAKFIYEADICVVSGGITFYECMLLSKKTFVACQIEHQIDSVNRYKNDADVIGLGIISKENYDALNKITDFLKHTYNPFKERKTRKFSNGLYKILNIIEELTG